MEVAGGNVAFEGGLSLPGLDAWVITRPHRGAASGGDVHYLSSCATGRITRLLLADVSGHGERVGRTSAALRDIMRRNVNFVDQDRVVRALNAEFAGVAGGRFATAIVGTYWEPTARLTLANAGHPRPLLRRRGEAGWSVVSVEDGEEVGAGRLVKRGARAGGAARGDGPTDLPLGIEEGAAYRQVSVRLGRGDSLLLYTDALVEAGAASGGQIGEAGLIGMLEGRDGVDAAAFLRELLRDVEGRGGGALDDDATAILLRRSESRASFVAGLGAPVRIARSVFGEGPAGWPQLRADNILGTVLPWLNGRRGE
ncbi:MAG: serine/threonine-protein phosphatase [Phycisphaeraceae bacterium]|nr:serine/threonine-protein phosphatase [Phycisphaeraceae bacterium]